MASMKNALLMQLKDALANETAMWRREGESCMSVLLTDATAVAEGIVPPLR